MPNPYDYIDKLTKKYSSPDLENLPVFTGGLIGYFSYESFKHVEPKLKFKASQIPLISLCECHELIVLIISKERFLLLLIPKNKTLDGYPVSKKKNY